MTDRQLRAQRIIAHPSKHKICFGCESVIHRQLPVCPNCKAYHFEEDEDAIIQQARQLGNAEQRTVVPTDLAS